MIAKSEGPADPNVRYEAARLDCSVDRMLELFACSKSPTGIRICALAFIAEHAPRDEAVRVATDVLRTGPSSLTREGIRVLGNLRARESVPLLCAVCRHIEGNTALLMARALEQIGGAETEPGLRVLLELPDRAVRLRVLAALERACGVSAAVGRLSVAALDGNGRLSEP